jgi:hypothetical protein
MKRFLLVTFGMAICLSLGVPSARAQTSGVTASYAAGYNMVGGPAGTDFSAADFMTTYSSSGYTTPASKVASQCQGYWAWFTSPTVVTLNPSATGPTQTCPVQVGWNLIGNPFAGAAALPTGTLAYYWDTAKQGYDQISAIPPGGAAWVYAASSGSITLTIVSTTNVPATTVTIDAFDGAGPFQVHVGDSVKVQVPATTPMQATANPTFLQLETAGVQGDMSCVNTNSCAISLVNRFWIYQAIAAGKTFIVFAPTCLTAHPACGLPEFAIEIDILP